MAAVAWPLNDIERLARRILAGDVVFFIGAGFSLDSEGNTAERLLARLLARFTAMTKCLSGHTDPALQRAANELRTALPRTFDLKSETDFLGMVTALAPRYFYINDWFCSAFGELLDKTIAVGAGGLVPTINREENEILRGHGDQVELPPIDLHALEQLAPEVRGKALLLETMGFAEPRIMGGCGMALVDGYSRLDGLYHGLILDRHKILARLAREGLCPTLLTTNFDLLLEGGYRLAGFVPVAAADAGPASEPRTTYPRVVRIAGPSEFSRRGAAYRSVAIVKIHGCAEVYRESRSSGATWQRYLPSLVFTFREIQNWRKDFWSRDLVNTLLRTRTMVFCGYSGADPVLHDTFRTIYEEMRSQRGDESDGSDASDAPAYVLGRAGSMEFHGIEILRAASRAAGAGAVPLTSHRNYIPFHFPSDAARRFPTLDEVMVWLFHRVFRQRQAQALDTDLQRVVTTRLRRLLPEAELTVVRERFKELMGAENATAATWTESRDARWEFLRVVGWSNHFHPAMLRNFAIAETVVRSGGPSVSLEAIRTTSWYYPIADNPGWAAWGVVLEIALRRMVAAWQGDVSRWAANQWQLQAVPTDVPALWFSGGRDERTPRCLMLRLLVFDRPGARLDAGGVHRRLHAWELRPDIAVTVAAAPGTPKESDIWEWAVGPRGEPDVAAVTRWLGADNG